MLDRVAQGSRALTALLRVVSAGLLGALLLLTAVHVTARYVFDSPLLWSEEVMRYLVIMLTFVGAAYAMGMRSHLSVELLDGALPPRARDVTAGLALLLSLVALVLLVLGSLDFVEQFAQVRSPSARIPRGWLYGSVLVSLGLTALLALLHGLLAIFGHESARTGRDADVPSGSTNGV